MKKKKPEVPLNHVQPAAAAGVAATAGAGMFATADAMKDEIYADIDKREYNVADFYWETGICQAIATNERFGSLTLFIIACNAIWIGYDTQNNEAETLNRAET